MKLKNLAVSTLVASGFAVAANATVLDFEGLYSGNVKALGTEEAFGGAGITFSSSKELFAVKTGSPRDGFVPNDNPLPIGVFGDYFLTSDIGQVTELNIKYDAAVDAASFDMADIDGLQDGDDQQEIFTFMLFLNDVQVGATRTVKDGDPGTGDRNAVTIGFSGLGQFDEIRISGTTEGGQRAIGIAFDNFNTTVDTTIPLPAAAWMLLAGIGGLGAVARRKKSAAK